MLTANYIMFDGSFFFLCFRTKSNATPCFGPLKLCFVLLFVVSGESHAYMNVRKRKYASCVIVVSWKLCKTSREFNS